MNTADLAVGIDIGGTKIKCGVVDMGGDIIGVPRELPTNANGPREKIVSSILELLHSAISSVPDSRIRGIGIGCTGPLDIKTGTILDCNNLPTMHNYPLKHIIELTTCKEVRMNNDANAMMLGETRWGAGRGHRTVLGITLGTGIGCAFIQDNVIYDGFTGNAGEIWQSPYRDGVIEDYCSGPALTRLYKKKTGVEISGKEIAERASSGELAAVEVFDEFSDALCFALSWVINTLDPDAVVIGGSVMNSSKLFVDSTREKLRRYLSHDTDAHLQLCPARLGDNAGFMGAAALMFE